MRQPTVLQHAHHEPPMAVPLWRRLRNPAMLTAELIQYVFLAIFIGALPASPAAPCACPGMGHVEQQPI